MTLLEAIDIRCSRRTYKPESMEKKAVEALQEVVATCSREGNVSMAFIVDNGEAFQGFRRSYGMFTGVRNYVCLLENKEDPHGTEKLGYYGERFALSATALGLGTCWVGGTFDKSSCPVALKEGQRILCAISVGPVEKELKAKERLIRGVTHLKAKKAEDMFTADAPAPGWFLAGMEAVEKAPSAINRQPVRFALSGGEVTATVPNIADIGTALDFGIAKLHFELGARSGKWDWGNGAAFHR